jgi:ectoine hydroxylase-related dioxygenase (phytanoyl-CoA dioxygenase family)
MPLNPRDEGIDFQPTSIGVALDRSASAWAQMRDSTPYLNDIDVVRERMSQDGYVLLRNVLDKGHVMAARKQVLDDSTAGPNPPDGTEKAGLHTGEGTRAAVHGENHRFPAVRNLVRSDAIGDIFRRYFAEPPRAYDYIWLRTATRGQGTGPHCDIVYMGRGAQEIYTVWMPLGDVPLSHGPIIVLEGSHRAPVPLSYLTMDIDAGRNWSRIRYRHGRFFRGGDYSRNPRAVQRQFGLRWLSTNFNAGDILIFSARTMHGTLDNLSNELRISVDARYQRLSEPADDRWVGPHPAGHKR